MNRPKTWEDWDKWLKGCHELDGLSIRELQSMGYLKWALWRVCPYSFHNPRLILGENKWPVGCLRWLNLW